MNNNIIISTAEPSDSKLLSVLFKTVYIDTYGKEGVTDEFANFIKKQFSPNKIEKDIMGSNCEILVAKFKNNPVGVLQIEYKNLCPIGNSIIPEINKLYVLQHFFGQGIGQKLMTVCETKITKKDYKQVWLWVLESNHRAVNFYNKQGYDNIGTADFQMETNNYKNIVMKKKL